MFEKNLQILFGQWLQKNIDHFSTSAFELKLTKGGTFNFKNWEKKEGHQIRNLLRAGCNTGAYHKISDQSMGQKPFDCFLIKNSSTFLVIGFEKFRICTILNIHDVWPKFRGESIKFDEARELAFLTFKF